MKKFKLIDLFVVTIVIIFLIFLFLPQHKSQSDRIFVTYQTNRDVEVVYPEAQKTKEVYLNSQKDPVKVVSVEKAPDLLTITLEGEGKIEEGRYLFNNARVLVGQKAELHGMFWSQGIIKKVEYAK